MYFKNLTDFEAMSLATIFFIGRYVLLAGTSYLIFYGICKSYFLDRKIQKKWPKLRQIRAEIGYSLLTLAIFGSTVWLFIIWNQAGHTMRYESINTFGMPYFVLSVFLMIIVHDAYFYWTHRLMHTKWVFPYVHRVHHRFHSPTPWAAFALHPLESVVSLGIIPIIIFCIPYHPYALLCFVTYMTGYNAYIHLGYRIRGRSRGTIRNTTEDHDYHHKKGHGNYGLYFSLWDRMMGTYVSARK
jgi:sterol desaturase/sphingolipid hydroxylase (fatty acid hydroxylase superfamily)